MGGAGTGRIKVAEEIDRKGIKGVEALMQPCKRGRRCRNSVNSCVLGSQRATG